VNRVNRALDSYLRMLAGPVRGRAGRWRDVRWPEPSSPSEMGREFLSAERLTDAGVLIEALARHIDVYIGIALHDRKAGDRTSVSRSHLAWTDIDREDAQDLLDDFPRPPTMTVSTAVVRSPCRRGRSASAVLRWRHVADGRQGLTSAARGRHTTCTTCRPQFRARLCADASTKVCGGRDG
jgi:hypothetical protein